MSFGVYEINPNVIEESETCPDSVTDNLVFEHLKRYCSKFDPLPAVTAKIDGGRLVVAEGHKYLRIAQELNRGSIRTIILGNADDALRDAGIEAQKLPVESLHAEQAVSTFIDAWHVVFVSRSLDPIEADDVQERVRSFVDGYLAEQHQIVGAFKSRSYDPASRCFEFEFTTPTDDKQWADQFLRLLVETSERVGGIESYQGRKFVHTAATIPQRV